MTRRSYRSCRRARRGAALVVALVTIAVLASVTAIASSQARQAASVVDNRRSQATARAMAESGVLAARAHIETRLREAGADSTQRDRVFDALLAGTGSVVQDTVGDGVFATAVVDVSARLDVNTAGADGLQQLLATVAPPGEARRLAEAIEAHVRGDASVGASGTIAGATPAPTEAMEQRLQRDLLIAQQAESARNLALARRLLRRLDKFQYLIAGGEPLKLCVFGHVLIGPPYQYPLYRGRACKEASAVRRCRVYWTVAHGQL